MALGYFIGIGGMPLGPTGAECYERYPVMRRWCEQVESWTGLEMRSAFTEDHTRLLAPLELPDPSIRPEYLYRGSIRQATHAIGMSDVLAEQGIFPDLVVGTSLGGLIAACLAGSIEREDLFRIFARVAEMPLTPDGEPVRGVAFIELPPDADFDWYYGESRPHVHMAAELENNGDSRIFMLSGYLEDLEKLSAETTYGQVHLITAGMGAVHCPDLQFMSDLLEPFLDAVDIRDPRIPLLCGVGGEQSKTAAQLKTSDDVRRSILENYVAPVGSFRQIIAALGERDLEMAIAVGAALPVGVPTCPFPVLQANVPDDIGQIMTMIYDLGIAAGG